MCVDSMVKIEFMYVINWNEIVKYSFVDSRNE